MTSIRQPPRNAIIHGPGAREPMHIGCPSRPMDATLQLMHLERRPPHIVNDMLPDPMAVLHLMQFDSLANCSTKNINRILR